MKNLQSYNKTWVMLAGAVVTILSRHYGAAEWLQDLELVLTALGVYQTPNKK